MAVVVLLLHWISISMSYAVLHFAPAHSMSVKSRIPSNSRIGRPGVAAAGNSCPSFLARGVCTNSCGACIGCWVPNFCLNAPLPTTQRGFVGRTHIFACRPRPKKEKARRNYQIAKQQKQVRQERLIQRRQQLELFRAQQRLLSLSETNTESKDLDETQVQTSETGGSFSSDGFVATAGPAKREVPGGINSPLPARINYRLVGGTWRRARGQSKFVRLSGAQMAAAIFQGLPEDEVAAAVAKAKRQDEGFMDLEAYDDSDSQYATLEGMN
ncbi:hypothetical protein, conserved [Eimeria necatrix]|uniref:Uncharacterized protein n=1 Tax=Eimeria necatrix TaxID=51315 RepID=U6MTK7_9EIME|nr:hypothetical protein, conserved [Eimeria necatrix]CDJ65005.1 hypothetical protein, conserved [Eimeria necatrix]